MFCQQSNPTCRIHTACLEVQRWSFNVCLYIQIESRFQEATNTVEEREAALDNVSMAISFLKKLTPHAVGACRSLSCELYL